MKIKTLLITSILGLGVVQTSLATPSACPSVSAIKAVGFDRIEPMSRRNYWYAAQLKNKYDTDTDWSFVILYVHGHDMKEATHQAAEMLSMLNGGQGPIETPAGTACTYKIGGVEGGLAISPPYNLNISNLASLIKKK